MAKNHAKAATPAGELLPDDATCRKCRYSLAGLPLGSVCPECGTPVVRARHRRHYLDENMTDAPVPYLRLLALGCWCLALGGPGVLVLFLIAFRQSSLAFAGLAALAGLVWLAGAVLTTRPRETTARASVELRREWRRLRPIARACAAGWALGPLMYAGAMQANQAAIAAAAAAGTAFTPTPALIGLNVTAALFLLIGLCGLVPLGIILVDLCDWAGDGALSERLRLAASGVASGSVLVAVCYPAALVLGGAAGPFKLLLFGGSSLGVVLVIAGFLFYLFCTIQLAGMSLWAVSNSITAIERDERIARKKAEHAEEMVGRVLRTQAATAIPAPGKGAPRKSAAPAAPPKKQSPQQPRPTGNPYDVAPEEP